MKCEAYIMDKNSFLGILTLVCLLLLCSCGKGGDGLGLEKDDNKFQVGQAYYREGRYQESMTLFLNIIENRRDAPQSHLEVGRLYLEHFNDPLAAIYHFKKFLEIKPDVEQSSIVRQMIERAKKTFAQTLPGRPFDDDVNRVDLMDLLQQVQEENLALKKQIARLSQRKQGSIPTHVAPSKQVATLPFLPAQKSAIQKFNQYTIEAGDTLSKISTKVYGTAADWERIYKANNDNLKTPNDLKIGQVLKIPVK